MGVHPPQLCITITKQISATTTSSCHSYHHHNFKLPLLPATSIICQQNNHHNYQTSFITTIRHHSSQPSIIPTISHYLHDLSTNKQLTHNNQANHSYNSPQFSAKNSYRPQLLSGTLTISHQLKANSTIRDYSYSYSSQLETIVNISTIHNVGSGSDDKRVGVDKYGTVTYVKKYPYRL